MRHQSLQRNSVPKGTRRELDLRPNRQQTNHLPLVAVKYIAKLISSLICYTQERQEDVETRVERSRRTMKYFRCMLETELFNHCIMFILLISNVATKESESTKPCIPSSLLGIASFEPLESKVITSLVSSSSWKISQQESFIFHVFTLLMKKIFSPVFDVDLSIISLKYSNHGFLNHNYRNIWHVTE